MEKEFDWPALLGWNAYPSPLSHSQMSQTFIDHYDNLFNAISLGYLPGE